MSRERSVLFAGKTRKTWAPRALLGVLAGAGLLIARAAMPVSTTAASSGVLPATLTDRAAGVARTSAVGTGSDANRDTAPRRDPLVLATKRAARLDRSTAALHRSRTADPVERLRLVNVAHRELETLELQEPKYFLAVFDMMKDEDRWDEKTLEAGRSESHRYILARMKVLSGMLRRFIDDPESDYTLETDRLAEIDDEFKTRIDALSRDVPALANIQELLTNTILKAPAFTDPTPETE